MTEPFANWEHENEDDALFSPEPSASPGLVATRQTDSVLFNLDDVRARLPEDRPDLAPRLAIRPGGSNDGSGLIDLTAILDQRALDNAPKGVPPPLGSPPPKHPALPSPRPTTQPSPAGSLRVVLMVTAVLVVGAAIAVLSIKAFA